MSVSKTSKQHQLKVSQLLGDLRSGDETKIASAIKAFHAHGDASVIAPLIEVWSNGLSEENEALLTELFQGLKDTTTIEPLMDAYRDERYSGLRRSLTAVFWNSKLDFSPFLADFVLFAVEGDFMDALEAITLIEQFEGSIPEHAIMESQLLLKEYFGGTENRDEQKDAILTDMAILLKDFDSASGTEDLFLE